MRILIAEDDPVLADGLCRALRRTGYAVDHVNTGSDADSAASTQQYDLMILDIGLPKMSGHEVLKRLRSRTSGVNTKLPVLVLSAMDDVEDRVRGLDLGADDYMSKPFELVELEARVRALMRRGFASAPTLIQNGALSFDVTGRTAYLNEQPLELSARELGLLEILVQRAGRLVSKDQLVQHLCEWGDEVSTNAIEVYVHRLRKKLEPGASIATVRGLGYCLEKAGMGAEPA